MLFSAAFHGDPLARHPRRIVTDVLPMTACEVRHPMSLIILVKSDNFSRHAGRVQQGEEPAGHFLAAWNDGNAGEERFIGVGEDAVEEDVDDRGAARARRVVGAGTMQSARMMKGGFAFLQFNRQGIELLLQLIGQAAAAGFQIAG